MTLSQIVYNIKNLLEKGQSSDDVTLSDRQWSFIVNYYRAKIIKQNMVRGMVSDQFKQRTIISYDQTTGSFLLPSMPIEDGITYVGTQERRFTRIKFGAIPYSEHARVTGRFPRWYLTPNAIKLHNEKTRLLKKLQIEGVFEDPSSVAECNNPKCGLDFEYPLPMNYVDMMIKMIGETELSILTSLPADITNDGLNQFEQIQGGNG